MANRYMLGSNTKCKMQVPAKIWSRRSRQLLCADQEHYSEKNYPDQLFVMVSRTNYRNRNNITTEPTCSSLCSLQDLYKTVSSTVILDVGRMVACSFHRSHI